MLIACSFLIDFVLPVSLVVQNLGYYWPRSALWNVFIIIKLLLYVEFFYLYLNIEDRAGWPYLDTLKLKVWTLFGMVPYKNGPAEDRTWFAPVSIQPRLYLADLCIWLCQVAVICALFAFHIGLCMPLLFIVLLFRNYDFNVGLLSKPDDREALQVQQSNKTRANWLKIFGALLTLVPMFFFMWLFPMYIACRLQETLPARTRRLVMRHPKKQGGNVSTKYKEGQKYFSLKRV